MLNSMATNIIILFTILQTLFISLNCESTSFVDKDSKLVGFAEKQWFKDNIPFVEVPDKNIEDVYYYRWASHKRHLRYLYPGAGYHVTEFVHDVGYGIKFGVINAAGGHQIHESRWLRNQRYVKDYINFYARQETRTGNHQYSEWTADSAYNTYLLNGDKDFIVSQLDGFVNIYNQWSDHFEPKLGLYFIAPVWDAMEYSAPSVQTSDKFGGGIGYRPSHNSEMYGNAQAIVKIAQLSNNVKVENEFKAKAKDLREAIITHLWDKERNFFYHVQRQNNPDNKPLDTREEVGFFPWRFLVPDDRHNYSIAWNELFDEKGFNSKYGPTTCEMRSKWYDGNQKSQCCWWNGNSWPYSTAHVLSSLKAQVKHYNKQNPHITADTYTAALKKYAITQYKNNVPYVAECHSPQGDFWVCDSRNHSEHYAHSTFNDNVLSELIGITPRNDDNFEIDPLIPNTWKYFIAENVLYHGHDITVLYDADGTRYKQGGGMKVFVNGKLAASNAKLEPMVVPVPKPVVPQEGVKRSENYAANAKKQGYPRPYASFTDHNPGDTWQAVDGRRFYDSIPSNRWSNFDSKNDEDWFAVDFGRSKAVNTVSVYVFDDEISHSGRTGCPTKMNVQYYDGSAWKDTQNQIASPAQCTPNDVNKISFNKVETNQIRVVFTRNKAKDYYVGITEIEIWAEWPQTPSPDIYEAEDGILTDAIIGSSPTASGKSYVGQIDKESANVEFSGIYSKITGDVKLRVYYANGEGKPGSQSILINNLHTVTINYPVTKSGWGHFDENSYVEVTVPLLRGNNVLIFKHAVNFAELDKIALIH